MSAFTKRSDCISRMASADLSAKQFHFLVASGDDTATFAGTAGVGCIGVMNNHTKAKQGEAVSIDVGPICLITLSATLAANAVVSTTNVGQAKAAASGEHRLGRLLYGGGANDLVPMFWDPDGIEPE